MEGKRRELNPMLRDGIYRIAREALRDAFRHAKAQKIEAEITYATPSFYCTCATTGAELFPRL
jgi:signal transduction histidine kinase